MELLRMKGYGSSRIKALLKKRRAKASSDETEDADEMPLADMLARSEVTGYALLPPSLKPLRCLSLFYASSLGPARLVEGRRVHLRDPSSTFQGACWPL